MQDDLIHSICFYFRTDDKQQRGGALETINKFANDFRYIKAVTNDDGFCIVTMSTAIIND